MKESLEAFTKLTSAKSLKCTLREGYETEWKKGEPVMERGRFSQSDDPTIFDSINLKNRSARMIGNVAAGDVAVFATASGLTFLEKTDSGNIVITTVFPIFKEGTQDFICVHSRHFFSAIPKAVLPSQYHGTCQVWDEERLRGSGGGSDVP